jgi:hypothetical protein
MASRVLYSAHCNFLASAVWVGNLLQKLSIFFFDKKHAKRMQLMKPFFPFPNLVIYSHAVHFREGDSKCKYSCHSSNFY